MQISARNNLVCLLPTALPLPRLCLPHSSLGYPFLFYLIILRLQSLTQILTLYKSYCIIFHIQKALTKHLKPKFIPWESKAWTVTRGDSFLISTAHTVSRLLVISVTAGVMANFMGQLDWATGHEGFITDVSLLILLRASVRVFPDETNSTDWVTQITLPNVGAPHLINWRPKQNKKTESEGTPPAPLPWAGTWVFYCFWT